MNEKSQALYHIYENTAEQADKLRKNLFPVDEEILHNTFDIVQKIFETTGRALPKSKIKYLLSSPDKAMLLSRVGRLGKRFFKPITS